MSDLLHNCFVVCSAVMSHSFIVVDCYLEIRITDVYSCSIVVHNFICLQFLTYTINFFSIVAVCFSFNSE